MVAESTSLLNAESVRGGVGALSKASIVRVHGFVSAAFGTVFVLESFGIKIPLIGPSAAIGGFDNDNAAMMFVTRFLGCMMIGLGLIEQNVYADSAVHKLYDQYHVLAAVGLWISSKVCIHYTLVVIFELFKPRPKASKCLFVLTPHITGNSK